MDIFAGHVENHILKQIKRISQVYTGQNELFPQFCEAVAGSCATNHLCFKKDFIVVCWL